jgi:hypothetical protein
MTELEFRPHGLQMVERRSNLGPGRWQAGRCVLPGQRDCFIYVSQLVADTRGHVAARIQVHERLLSLPAENFVAQRSHIDRGVPGARLERRSIGPEIGRDGARAGRSGAGRGCCCGFGFGRGDARFAETRLARRPGPRCDSRHERCFGRKRALLREDLRFLLGEHHRRFNGWPKQLREGVSDTRSHHSPRRKHMRNTIKMLGLVFVLALSACGGADRDHLGRFVGTWRATSGTFTMLCPGYAPSTDPISGNRIWSSGVSSDLISTDPNSTCAIMADVNGATASGVPGQTCTGPDGIGGIQTETLDGYTFVISADGQTATENMSGHVNYVVEGASLVCSFNESGSYQKIGN